MTGKLSFLAGAAAALGFGWFSFPGVLYQKAEQPMQFSHKVHATTAGMACADCHSVEADGRFTGIPATEKCASCHSAALGSTKDEKILVETYVQHNREIPWKVYSRQPDNVYFSHANHVARAGLTCERCHGDHGKTEKLRPYEYNPITGYSRDIGEPKLLRMGRYSSARPLKMDDCAACHEERRMKSGCLDCHR